MTALLFWLVTVVAAEGSPVPLLRHYCKACHAVGELRFLTSPDDVTVEDFIRRERAPVSKRIWVEAIRDVLAWPTDAPPPFDQSLAPGRDWMPKGSKRLALARDVVDGEPARRRLLALLD